jgi:hypothetical protein
MQGFAAAGRTMGGQRNRFMNEALSTQAMENRMQGLRAADVSGPGAQTSARAGSAAEYAFFVRRQQQARSQELAMAAERNVLLRDIQQALSDIPRDPVTGDIINYSGI